MVAYIAAGSYSDAGSLDGVFWAASALLIATLFVLGSYKGRVTRQVWWKSGLLMAAEGAITTLLAYFIGLGISKSAG